MKKSFWQKILIGFNPNFYKEIAFQPLRQGFKFFTLFLLLLGLILTFKYSYDFYKLSQETVKVIPTFFEKLKDFPEIKIEKGEIISPKEKFTQKWGDFSLIIDIEGEIEFYLKELEEKGGLILLKNKAISKTVQKTEIHDFSEINYFNLRFDHQKSLILEFDGKTYQLTSEKIKSWANRIPLIIFPFLFIFTFIFLFIVKSIQILFFSFISLIVNKVKKLNLRYSNLLNVGIFALIPPLAFETLIKLSGLKIPYFGLIYALLYLTFLITGLLKLRTCSSSVP